MKKYLPIVARVLLALPMIFSGANKLLKFVDLPPPSTEAAQLFLGAMFSSYLGILVGVVEVLGGLLLLVSRKTALLGALILLPVTANILIFHLAHDLAGVVPGLVLFLLNLSLLFYEKDRLLPILSDPE